MTQTTRDVLAIDAVVNIWTDDALAVRPDSLRGFYVDKIGTAETTYKGVSLEQMLERMDAAGVERAFLIAVKCGRDGLRSHFRVPYEVVYKAVQQYPDRFYGLAGIDPFEGMAGVRELERAVKEFGFIGAHYYPHWFEIPPDHRKMYPYYVKCIELGIPIQMQVGQSLVYTPDNPMRSVGQPILLDTVACDLPELKLIGIHVGIPWTDEMIAMAWKHPNVFIGTDAHSPKYWPQSFVHYINTYGQDKVIFGTDFPVLDFGRTMREIDALNFRPAPLRKLLRDNVMRIYGLSETGA
ncbi:MAG: amidohydrolase [Gammaproteobacteria bacterium]|nr:amidohydrolase [Gammaproteobacteria bacterium]